MDDSGLKKNVLSGLMWTFLERIGAQGVSFVVSMVLARLLLPEEYGMISLVLVFINLANVFVSSGLGESLIQKEDATEEDFSTIFYISLGLSALIYLILFVSSDYIADFYRMPLLSPVIKVFALKLPISAISTVQHAYVSKHMMFKKFFFSTLGGTIFSGVVGIGLALGGFGVWALVAQYLTNTVIDTIVLFFTVPWHPKLLFSKESGKCLFSFGWKLVVANLINHIYIELRSLIIGRMYSAADLAYYNRGNQLPSLAITNIDAAIGKVIFPTMVKVKDSPEHLKAVSRRAMKTTTFLIFPVMMGCAIVANELITVLFTTKWIMAVPYLRLACVFYACQPIQTTNWQIIKACGRSDICFKLELIKKTIGITLILISMKFGVFAIAASASAFGIISMVINMLPNRKLIQYSFKEQMRDFLQPMLYSLIMGAVVFAVSLAPIPTFPKLLFEVFVGVVVYVVVACLVKDDVFFFILGMLKNKKRSKK